MQLKRLVDTALGVSALLAIGCVSARQPCVEQGSEMTLAGTVEDLQVFGPPNFGETPDKDERRVIKVLHLIRRPTLCGVGSLPKRIQIVSPTATKMNFGTGVQSLTGVISPAENAFHYTDPIFVLNSSSE